MPTRRKWQEYYDLPEIVEIRKLIKDTYSNKLVFLEEPHEYYLDGIQYDCVSHITHRFKPVSTQELAHRCFLKGQRDPGYKYAGMSEEEIIKLWEENSEKSCSFGTSVHEFGESMFYYMAGEDEKILESCRDRFVNGIPCPQNELERAVVAFWNDIPDCMVPVLSETKVFNKLNPDGSGTAYAGTFDILFYYVEYPGSPKNGLVIFDYKTNGALTQNPFEKLRQNYNGTTLLAPFDDLLDCDESYYKLQLACYQIPMENVGLKVIGRRIIWLHPDGTYEKISEPDLSVRMRNALRILSREEKYNNYLITNGL